MCTTRATLRALEPHERIAALADGGAVAPASAALAAARASPHLGRWGIAAQDDDGIAFARIAIGGAPVLVAAQDEGFLGGSVGARHGDALHALFELARQERPAAVLLLMASGGVRLHEANPAELALARALAALFDLRAAGVPVLALGVGDLFGGASVVACAADRIALVPGTRLGLSGPRVIESVRGRDELDAGDADAVNALFGAEARAAAGHVELVSDVGEGVRDWIEAGIARHEPFEPATASMQRRLAERLALNGDRVPRPPPLPQALMTLYAQARPADAAGWLWRMDDANVWLTRALGAGTFGPGEALGLDTALLAQLAGGRGGIDPVLFLIGDSAGHEASRAAETVCVSQYLAHHAAVLALLRGTNVRQLGLLTGAGHSAAFFCNALQAGRVYALPSARVVAMDPAAIARVTGQDPARFAALVEDDALVGHPVRHFARWGGITEMLPDADAARLIALAAAARY